MAGAYNYGMIQRLERKIGELEKEIGRLQAIVQEMQQERLSKTYKKKAEPEDWEKEREEKSDNANDDSWLDDVVILGQTDTDVNPTTNVEGSDE